MLPLIAEKQSDVARLCDRFHVRRLDVFGSAARGEFDPKRSDLDFLVDFALEQQRQHGLTPEQAIYQACTLRFRPILMTTMAALLGGVPLMVGTGTGSELRQPLGYTIVGGLMLSQILTLYTTPVVYLYLDRLGAWFTKPKPHIDNVPSISATESDTRLNHETA